MDFYQRTIHKTILKYQVSRRRRLSIYLSVWPLSRRQLCRGVGFCDVQAKSALVRIGASVSIMVCVGERGGGGGGGGGGVRCEAVGYVVAGYVAKGVDDGGVVLGGGGGDGSRGMGACVIKL